MKEYVMQLKKWYALVWYRVGFKEEFNLIFSISGLQNTLFLYMKQLYMELQTEGCENIKEWLISLGVLKILTKTNPLHASSWYANRHDALDGHIIKFTWTSVWSQHNLQASTTDHHTSQQT